MVSVNSNNIIMPYYNVSQIRNNKTATPNTITPSVQKNRTNVTFGAGINTTNIRTSLATKEEKEKYNTVSHLLNREDRKLLDYTLKSGVLLNNNSNDKSSVLDNLYKMSTTQRADGLDNKKLVQSTLTSIANPYTITQKFGDIPKEYKNVVVDKLTNNSQNLIKRKATELELQNLFSGCCVAASEQFNLASKQPAEYARFAEGLTSPAKSVNKDIKFDSLSENTMDAIWLLNSFDIPYTAKDFKTAKVKLAPDENAYIRANIQQNYRDNQERSSIDVLMQSTFMNVASQQTYNSLNDKRAGKFSNEDSGLIDYEKTFLESVVEDKNTMSVTYQNVDENQTIVGYATDYDTVKSQLLETLDRGNNVIIGYTLADSSNKIIGAHEITITGHKTAPNGDLIFVCNDTDDDVDEPVEYPATYLIPKIHHAGLPEDIAMRNMDVTETWKYNIRELNNKNVA